MKDSTHFSIMTSCQWKKLRLQFLRIQILDFHNSFPSTQHSLIMRTWSFPKSLSRTGTSLIRLYTNSLPIPVIPILKSSSANAPVWLRGHFVRTVFWIIGEDGCKLAQCIRPMESANGGCSPKDVVRLPGVVILGRHGGYSHKANRGGAELYWMRDLAHL